ncbi:MinD/ParA family protein [Natrialbaceae archaeon A-CW1-1]
MIIAVSGGKGGVGKSTLSLNLGYELDAVVVDADLLAADLPVRTTGGPTLHEVLAGRVDPLDAVETVGAVRILSCGQTLEGARASILTDVPRVVERLRRRYGRVVIDCPAGLARDVGVCLHSADLAVLVTMPDRVALSDAARTQSLAADVGTPVASIVLNQCRDPVSDSLCDRVEATMGAPVVAIDRRAELASAQAAGRPLREQVPSSPVLDALESLTRLLERCE